MAQNRLKLAERATAGRTHARPGAALKALRMQRGWTLAEVSERTELPVSTLSKIENDRMSLSYDKLARISAGLDVDISQLFTPQVMPGATVNGRRSVTAAGQGQSIETDNYAHLYPAADFLNKRFVPVVAELRSRTLEESAIRVRNMPMCSRAPSNSTASFMRRSRFAKATRSTSTAAWVTHI
jgi:transcriptional regulator with XRE-family HTH domain